MSEADDEHPVADEEGEADIVVETTGHPGGYAAARRLVRPRGAIVLKSTYHGALDADLTMTVVDEVTLVGSRCGPLAPTLRLLERGLVDVLPLVQARYPLSEVLTAFEHATRPGTLKVSLAQADKKRPLTPRRRAGPGGTLSRSGRSFQRQP